MLSMIVAAALGVLCHVGYLNRGEHHMDGVKYAGVLLLATVAGIGLLTQLGTPYRAATVECSEHATIFVAGIVSSLMLYRLFLNPLNRFPGPFKYKISSMLFSVDAAVKPAFQVLSDLHEKHGDYVRFGSADLSISDPKAILDAFGPESKCLKSSWYDLARPVDSLQFRRDKGMHDQQRRVWSLGFSDKALRGYEVRIQAIRNKLMQIIDDCQGAAVNVNHWMSMYSYDVMSDMAFGETLQMLENKQLHWSIKIIESGMVVLVPHFPIWFIRVLTAIPGGQRHMLRMHAYTRDMMLERRKKKPAVPDVMAYLLEPYKDQEKLDSAALNLLGGNSELLVVAGSDTTASTLVCALKELARQPEQMAKLRAELEHHVPNWRNEPIKHTQVVHLGHLNGVLRETLRLFPPVPTYPSRVTPPEGAVLGDRFVPGGTTIVCPQWVIGKKESIYPRARSFIPERWYEDPELVRNKAAWAPFSTGPMSCIGKPLALMNLRITLAYLVLRYNICFAPGQTDPNGEFDKNVSEHFTLKVPKLDLCLTRRV